jgi:NitT/TauT family transport system permease protein
MPIRRRWQLIWGEATALLDRSRRLHWIDLVLVAGLGGLLFGAVTLARQWTHEKPAAPEIDLSLSALPLYTFYSLSRGMIAYVLSLGFTLVYGYWAAKSRVAERVLVPVLDILQSIPVLGFMPGLLLIFVGLFPGSNFGLELAAIVAIFTGQAWNMTFSFYQSVRSVPEALQEAATVYRFTWWQRFKWVEVPYAMMGLVLNSMMSMAGGWFFLMTIEGLDIGEDKYYSPGIGSYIKQATTGDEWNWNAIVAGVIAMMLMIVALDQLLWRPVVAWAQKFRVEEGGAQEEATSWFLDLLRRSRSVAFLTERLARLRRPRAASKPAKPIELADPTQPKPWATVLSNAVLLLLVGALALGAYALFFLVRDIRLEQWGDLLLAALLTLGRVLAAVTLATFWALPAGLAIGLSPRLSRVLQPVVQVLASFPAPLLFPMAVYVLGRLGISLNWGSIVLMLLGTQWYILFNIIAGALAIPADLKEAARSYRITGWRLFRALYFPAVFPYLVTGWVTAAGGAWNASIVAEYIEIKNAPPPANGLGARIMEATAQKDDALLAASVLVMSFVVVLFNRTVWRYLYKLADRRFSVQR